MGILEKKMFPYSKILVHRFSEILVSWHLIILWYFRMSAGMGLRKRNKINASWYGYGFVLKKASTGTGRVRVEMRCWCGKGTGSF